MRSRELLLDDSQPIGIEISKVAEITPKEHVIRFAFGASLVRVTRLDRKLDELIAK
jgi:hypothetical protein